MRRHLSLREHLIERAAREHPVTFQASNDPPLVAFAQIFSDSGLYSFDVNKSMPENELSPVYVLTSEAVATAAEPPRMITRYWAPVLAGDDPMTGFHEGQDSALWGSTPADIMPPDENSRAFLLLVTSNYVHLSATREQDPPVVRGAIDEGGDEFTYVVLSE